MNIKQLRIISSNFAQEIQAASNGKINSLPFIVHELSPSPLVKDGEIFQSMAIGGTVGKITTLKKNGGAIQILDKKEEQLSFETAGEFLDFISRSLPEDVSTLALNFAYPIKPVFENGRLDGVLLAVTKEGGFHGLIGKQIGAEIEKYVLAKRNKKVQVSIANDTVCLLTSGLTQFKQGELAAGIVGTGFNIAFFLDKNRLVNLESANFDKFPHTKEGIIVDKESALPGKACFEKEVAGAYLYRHYNLIIKQKNLSSEPIKSTEELNRVGLQNIFIISGIAKNLIKRSAQLVACQIAGVAAFKKRNMVFNMEGSLFWKGNNYKEIVSETVKELVPEYEVTFVEITNSAILGAAKLIS